MVTAPVTTFISHLTVFARSWAGPRPRSWADVAVVDPGWGVRDAHACRERSAGGPPGHRRGPDAVPRCLTVRQSGAVGRRSVRRDSLAHAPRRRSVRFDSTYSRHPAVSDVLPHRGEVDQEHRTLTRLGPGPRLIGDT
ncbi:hypothetical protein NKH18_15580 [Streptomyces sp. M10(2022)]